MVLAELLTKLDAKTRIVVHDTWNHTAFDGTANGFYGSRPGETVTNAALKDRAEQMKISAMPVQKISMEMEKEMTESTELMGMGGFPQIIINIVPKLNIYLY